MKAYLLGSVYNGFMRFNGCRHEGDVFVWFGQVNRGLLGRCGLFQSYHHRDKVRLLHNI